MRESQFRINILDLMYQRELHDTYNFARWASADSSKQGRHNYFVVLQDSLRWPKTATVRDRLSIDLQSNITERHLATTTLGLGAAGVVWKSANTHHAISVETGAWEKFVKHREEILVWTSDQGDDFEISESPLLCSADGSDIREFLSKVRTGRLKLDDAKPSDVFFLPNALRLADSYHLMFGGFEAVVTTHIEYQCIEKHYTVIAHFLGDQDLRLRTLRCLDSKLSGFQSAAIKAWSVGHQFNWKWQYLLRFLAPLCLLLPILITHFDGGIVSRGLDGMTPIHMVLISEFVAALKYPQIIRGFARIAHVGAGANFRSAVVLSMRLPRTCFFFFKLAMVSTQTNHRVRKHFSWMRPPR